MPREGPNNKGLTPSDQLLGIFVVNSVIVVWVAIAFATWYESYPSISVWIYVAEAVILVTSLLSSVLDVVLLRLINLVSGRSNDDSFRLGPESLPLKIMNIALTVIYIFVLWRIMEETGGV